MSQRDSEFGTVRCCTSVSREDCASRNWSGSRWRTCPYNERRAFAFSARIGSNDAFRSGRKLPPTFVPGWRFGERSLCPSCSSLSGRSVSPHQLRHSCAVVMLQATRDIRKVALWLGHADIRTTEIYLRVDPSEKLEVLEAVLPPGMRRGRFKAPDALIASLVDPD